MTQIGVQQAGSSSEPIYKQALELVRGYSLPTNAKVADVGGGAGHFSKILLKIFDQVTLVDYEQNVRIEDVNSVHADLNEIWPKVDQEMDLVIALEVIEHLENPRHFIRQLISLLRPGGRAIVSTPNQLSLASRFCFILRGQHQHFQESCYPAHITPLLPVDFERICSEAEANEFRISYTNSGRIPGTKSSWQKVCPILKGQLFSDNFFVEFQRPSST